VLGSSRWPTYLCAAILLALSAFAAATAIAELYHAEGARIVDEWASLV
jgi:hypothetical protein